MKKIFLFFTCLLLNTLLLAQPADQQAYYRGVDFNKTGTALKAELATLVISTHVQELTYRNIWDATKITDINPNNENEVLLLYGWPEGTSSDYRKEYSRDKNNNGGNSRQWNREHTYPRSLGNPNLGYSGPGADAHHIRSCDVEWNANRGNLKFVNSSGFSKIVSGGWYPGDEWKGDVARMMMYMYLRYGTRCLPNNVGIGSTSQTPDGMIDLFLRWNAEDPVSQIEIRRNDYHGNRNNIFAQGNRNPFIDNPRLATAIWGGPQAEDRWNTNLSTSKTQDIEFSIYPNPTFDHKIFIQTSTTIDRIQIFSLTGQEIKNIKQPEKKESSYSLEYLPQGIYILKIQAGKQNATQRIIVK